MSRLYGDGTFHEYQGRDCKDRIYIPYDATHKNSHTYEEILCFIRG